MLRLLRWSRWLVSGAGLLRGVLGAGPFSRVDHFWSAVAIQSGSCGQACAAEAASWHELRSSASVRGLNPSVQIFSHDRVSWVGSFRMFDYRPFDQRPHPWGRPGCASCCSG